MSRTKNTDRFDFRPCIIQTFGRAPNIDIPSSIIRVDIGVLDVKRVDLYVLIIELLAEMIRTFVYRHLLSHKVRCDSRFDIVEYSVESDCFESRAKNVVRKVTCVAQWKYSTARSNSVARCWESGCEEHTRFSGRALCRTRMRTERNRESTPEVNKPGYKPYILSLMSAHR